jgi:hypothetical protein
MAVLLAGPSASPSLLRCQAALLSDPQVPQSKQPYHAIEAGYAVRGAALVVGSLVEPASLHNEHIRAHALEGQLFRTVLEDTFRAQGISCKVFLEKGAYARAAVMLRATEAKAKRTIAQLGDSHQGSWRAEEKLAALAAWTMLTVRSGDE